MGDEGNYYSFHEGSSNLLPAEDGTPAWNEVGVIPDFLTPHEMASIRASMIPTMTSDDPTRELFWTSTAPRDFVFRVHQAAGYMGHPLATAALVAHPALPASILHETTVVHTDAGRSGFKTAFVFLNTNHHAFFRIHDMEIPVQAEPWHYEVKYKI